MWANPTQAVKLTNTCNQVKYNPHMKKFLHYTSLFDNYARFFKNVLSGVLNVESR